MGAAVLRRSNDTVWSTSVGEEMRLNSRKLPSSNRKTDRSAVRSCQRVGHGVLNHILSALHAKRRLTTKLT